MGASPTLQGLTRFEVITRLKRTLASLRNGALKALRSSTLDRPIFLVGTVRSGSTLFSRCLGSHPGVVYAGFELSAEWSRYARVPIACPDTNDPHCSSHDAASFNPTSARSLERHLAGLVAISRKPNARLVNKNPHLWNKLALVREMFPTASLIVTSRDLRSTVASTMRLWISLFESRGIRHYLPEDPVSCWDCLPPRKAEGLDSRRLFPGGDVRVLAEYWLRCYERIEQDKSLFDQVHVVQHREFIQAPSRVLADIWGRLGLDLAPVELPIEIDPTRNSRWSETLEKGAQGALVAFATEHSARISHLTVADTTV